jgi:hypothetical protein
LSRAISAFFCKRLCSSVFSTSGNARKNGLIAQNDLYAPSVAFSSVAILGHSRSLAPGKRGQLKHCDSGVKLLTQQRLSGELESAQGRGIAPGFALG